MDLGLLVDAAGDASTTMSVDVAGSYSFTAYEYREYTAPPAFPGDPVGEARSKLVSTSTGSVVVVEPMDLRVANLLGHDVTMRFTFTAAGLVATATFRDYATETARLASLDATVLAALATTVGVAVASIGPALDTVVENARTKYELHRLNTGGGSPVHASADATNVMRYEKASGERSAIIVLNDWRDRLVGHMTALSTGGTWHGIDDAANLPIVGPATDVQSGICLFADLAVRAYARHIAATGGSPAVHANADATNTLTAATTLVNAIAAYLDGVVNLSLTTPGNESATTSRAATRYGMTPAR